MTALLDTHAFLWFVENDSRLSQRARDVISDPRTDAVLSVASIWEIVIKSGTGQLRLKIDPERYVREQTTINRIRMLAIEPEHVFQVGRLPRHHRDPFDRMLIAQAIHEAMPIITIDTEIAKYPVTVVW